MNFLKTIHWSTFWLVILTRFNCKSNSLWWRESFYTYMNHIVIFFRFFLMMMVMMRWGMRLRRWFFRFFVIVFHFLTKPNFDFSLKNIFLFFSSVLFFPHTINCTIIFLWYFTMLWSIPVVFHSDVNSNNKRHFVTWTKLYERENKEFINKTFFLIRPQMIA